MKRFFFLLALPLLSLSAIRGGEPILTKAASGPTFVSGVPKNIDLNDTKEEDVRSYYASLNGRNLSGEDLLEALHPILQDLSYYTYDNVWKIYEITDREWELSPADSIVAGTYDPMTNTIANYGYGTSLSNPGQNNPYVRCLYRNRDENDVTVSAGQIRAWENHDMNAGGFNREHVWCQSRGFKADSGASGPAGTDLHHLMAADGWVNGKPHNNNPYGFVDAVSTDASTTHSFCAGNYAGSAVNASKNDESDTVFEPQDCDKGDIARACFYMVACYNNLSGKETITQFNPDLCLCDYATSAGNSFISSEVGHAVGMGILRDLLAWHRLDPVDDYEIHRNNLIYENYQHNRNPFIDFPDWVEAIWGKATLDPLTRKVAYDPTPVGYADPSKDDVRTLGEVPLVYIESEGMKTSFELGEDFVFDGTVYATDEKGQKSDVTADCLFSGYDTSTSGDQTVTVTHVSGLTTTYAIHVFTPAPSSSSSSKESVPSGHYIAIEDEGELRDGDKIVLAGNKGKNYYGLSVVQGTNNRGIVTLSNCDGTKIEALQEGCCELTLQKIESDSTWALFDEANNGYLQAASSSSNYLRTKTTLDENGHFAITHDEDGWSLVAQGNYTRNDLRFNSSNSIFACYGSGNYQLRPLLFKSYVDEADRYGTAFLDDYTAGCEATGVSSTLAWGEASNAFASLSNGAKNILSVLSSLEGSAPRHRCVERYDYIVGKYGSTTYADFMGRQPVFPTKNIYAGNSKKESLVYLYLFALLGFSGVALFTLCHAKKKKGPKA